MQEIKLSELQVSDDIMEIVRREVEAIKACPVINFDQVNRLEKITKIYGLLMASMRENVKNNIFGNLRLNEGEKLDNPVDGSSETAETDDSNGD